MAIGVLTDVHGNSVAPDGTNVLAVHASAIADDGPGISPATHDSELARLFPAPDVAGIDLIVGGHTHHATDRSAGARRFVNPGSISNHATDDRSAKYLLIDDDPAGHRLEFRQVPYDVAAVIEQIRKLGMPGGAFIVSTYFGSALS